MKTTPNMRQMGKTILLTICGIVSLGLIVWAFFYIIQNNCAAGSQGCPSLPWDLVPPFVALGFWVVGISAGYLKQPVSIVFFFLLSSATLAIGLLSGFGNDLAGRLFYIFLAWMSPVLLQFHLVWAMLPRRRFEREILRGLYLLASVWSFPFFIHPITVLQDLGWFSYLRSGVRFTVAMSLVVVIILMSIQFRRYSHLVTHFRVRLVLAGAVLAFAPFLLLSLLPSLFSSAFIPFEMNFAWLVIIPLSYGYSIASQYFLGSERVFVRIITYYLASVLFAGGYLIASDIVSFLVPDWANFWAWAIAGIGMILLFLIARVNQIIRQIATWILYGNDTSQLELLTQMTDSLGLVMNRERLRQILVNELATIIPATGVALLLKSDAGLLDLQGLIGFDWQPSEGFHLPANGKLVNFLKTQNTIVENYQVQKTLAQAPLVYEEHEILNTQDIGLWIPLVSGDELHGLLVIGCKPGGVLYNANDRQVWLIFAHQAGVAAHNLFLTENLSISRSELSRAHQQLLYAREQERRQIAYELHDNAVQQLLGINFQVVALQRKIHQLELTGAMNAATIAPGLDALHEEILRVTSQLRDMIGELRPAGLEEFGFGSALESFVNKLKRQTGHTFPQIKLDIDQNGHELPDSVKICLFRVSQELLRNSLKHANARQIQLTMTCRNNEIVFMAQDDGCGFIVPERLSELTQANHYGLVSIAERVAWVNGKLEIQSQPGEGTQIRVQIPL